MKLTKRILSVVLSVLMLVSMIPCFGITAGAVWEGGTNNGYPEPNNTIWNSAVVDANTGHVTVYWKNGYYYSEPTCTHLLGMLGTPFTLTHGTGSYDVWQAPQYGNWHNNDPLEKFFYAVKWYNSWCEANNYCTHKIRSVEIVMFSTYTVTGNLTWGHDQQFPLPQNPGDKEFDDRPNIWNPNDLSTAWNDHVEYVISRAAPALWVGSVNDPIIKVDHSAHNGNVDASGGWHLAIGEGITINNNATTDAQIATPAIAVKNYSLLMMRGGKITNPAAGAGKGYGIIVDGSNTDASKAGSAELFFESTIENCYAGVYQKTGITRFKEPTGNGYDLSRNTFGILMEHGTYIGKWTDNIDCITANNVKIGLVNPSAWRSGDVLMTSGYEWEYPASGSQILHYEWCMPDDVNSLNFVDGANPNEKLSIEWFETDPENPSAPTMADHEVVNGTSAIYPALVLTAPLDPSEVVDLQLDYDSRGGSAVASSEVVQIKKGGAHGFTVSSTIPVKSGWTFAGWNDYLYSDTHPVLFHGGDNYNASEAHHILYAVWDATLSYNGNGGSPVPASVTGRDATGAGSVTLTIAPTAPTNGDSIFRGWLAPDGHLYQPGESITITGDTEVVAQWGELEYANLNYDANASGDTVGNMPDAQRTVITDDLATFTVSTKIPTRQHYIFLGWAEDLQTPPTMVGATFTFAPAEPEDTWTLYALWQLMGTYTLSYDANGGTNAPASSTDYWDAIFYVTGGKPTRDNFDFLGWSDEPNGPVNEAYIEGYGMTLTADKTLYAVWQEHDKVALYYDANEGSFPTAPVSAKNYVGSQFPIENVTPVRDGFRFIGWSDTADGEAVAAYIVGYEFTLNADKTLYAVWEAIICTVVYNDGVLNEDLFDDQINENLAYNSKTPDFYGVPTRTGYRFTGWLDVDGNEVAETVTKEYVVYYAQWEQINVVILTYDFGVFNVYQLSECLLPDDSGKTTTVVKAGSVLPEGLTDKGDTLLFMPTAASYTVTFEVTTTFYVGSKPVYTEDRTVMLIPASNVYYEAEDFAEVVGTKGNWELIGEDPDEREVDDNFSTVYGYTEAALYDYTDYGFSANVSYKATLTMGAKATFAMTQDYLTFAFTGNGFDIISACGPNTGILLVKVVNDEGKTVKSMMIDTGFLGDGEVISGDDNLNKQVPLVRVLDLPFDTYTVSVYGWLNDTCTAYRQQHGNTDDGSVTADVYVDGFRVYGALESDEFYVANEQAVKYVSIFDFLSGSAQLIDDDYGTNPVLYMEFDSAGTAASIADYKMMGPENEVYLYNDGTDSAIGMVLTGYHAGIDTIMISAKSVSEYAELAVWQNGGLETITDFVTTETEMYYDMTPYVIYDEELDAYILIIGNATTDSILSVSMLKLSSHIGFLPSEVLEPRLPSTTDADFVPEYYAASFKDTVKSGRSATISFTTSLDVDHIVIKDADGEIVDELYPTNATAVEKGKATQYKFSYSAKNVTNDISWKAYALNSDGLWSDAQIIGITVQ